jgi:uncharacterized membrane protein YcaP (DUF421 family)
MNILFSGWGELLRMALVGLVGYVTLLLLLRTSGKRSLTKLTAYDFISTVALGSMLAAMILSSDVTLDKAVLGVALLFGIQRMVLWLASKSRTFRHLVTADPTLVFYRGQMLKSVIEQHDLTEDEIRAAVRSRGYASLDAVEFVVMEQDGTFSVTPRSGRGSPSAMMDVPEFAGRA